MGNTIQVELKNEHALELLQTLEKMNVLKIISTNFDKRETDFIAILNYKTTEVGGRKTPANSGYRPTIKFDFSEMQTSGIQKFIGQNVVLPGETVEAEINILSVDFFAGQLTEGMKFEFYEGSVVIGTGEVKHVLNNKLRKISQ